MSLEQFHSQLEQDPIGCLGLLDDKIQSITAERLYVSRALKESQMNALVTEECASLRMLLRGVLKALKMHVVTPDQAKSDLLEMASRVDEIEDDGAAVTSNGIPAISQDVQERYNTYILQ